MHTNADFPPANPVEVQPYTIDFINDLPTGQFVLGAAVTISLFQGTDPSPNSHIVGSPQITANPAGVNTMILQRVGGLLAGNIYSLNMVATTSVGFEIELYALIPCVAVYS
jgi:hypothetical protein